MLAQHCECGAPLFRYHGNVVCPICDSNGSNSSNKTGIVNKDNVEASYKGTTNKNSTPRNHSHPSTTQQSDSTNAPGATPPSQSVSSPSAHPPTPPMSPPPISPTPSQISASSASSNIPLETHEFISNTIINKVVQLCLDLQRETDLGRIKQQMEAIESGTKALKNLKKIK